MIKYVITEEGKHSLKTEGSMETLCADVTVLIKRIYECYKAADEMAAKAFVNSLVVCLLDPDSPFFQEVKND